MHAGPGLWARDIIIDLTGYKTTLMSLANASVFLYGLEFKRLFFWFLPYASLPPHTPPPLHPHSSATTTGETVAILIHTEIFFYYALILWYEKKNHFSLFCVYFSGPMLE